MSTDKLQRIACRDCGFAVESYDPNFLAHRMHIGWIRLTTTGNVTTKDEWLCPSCREKYRGKNGFTKKP